MTESLSRFYNAQEIFYPIALREIQNGKKLSHWMWFIFPQLRGLGISRNSYTFGITDISEARAYLANPILGARLYEISNALLSLETSDPEFVFGDIDAKKLCSSMTLFSEADQNSETFRAVLEKFFGGKKDIKTLALLNKNI